MLQERAAAAESKKALNPEGGEKTEASSVHRHGSPCNTVQNPSPEHRVYRRCSSTATLAMSFRSSIGRGGNRLPAPPSQHTPCRAVPTTPGKRSAPCCSHHTAVNRRCKSQGMEKPIFGIEPGVEWTSVLAMGRYLKMKASPALPLPPVYLSARYSPIANAPSRLAGSV